MRVNSKRSAAQTLPLASAQDNKTRPVQTAASTTTRDSNDFILGNWFCRHAPEYPPTSPRRGVMHDFPADYGQQSLDVLDPFGVACQQVVREHHQVAQFADFDRAFLFLVETQVGRVNGRHAQRLLA